ncbi:xanthine dehydrogenase family protein molybdopterin-binding subunit [Rhodoferax koreense]|nr:molybdopterin cofactor-binding domain-containing protein [Rhodoferax koreense]
MLDLSAPGASPSRRGFLKVSGAVGGGLMVGWWPLADAADAAAASAARPGYEANAFITIGADDSVTLTMAKVEMGQGIYTALATLMAEELEVDMNRVVLRAAPPDAKAYGAPFGDQFTGGSLSIRTMWEPMRQTGAATRMVLVQAAADGWKVPVAACHAEHGEVVHAASGRRIRYGQLVAAASRLPAPQKVALKPASAFKLIGKPLKRLDTQAKTNGTARFGIDAVLPGMLFASVAASPVFGGRLQSVNDAKALALPGVRQVVKLPNAVAVVADNTWYARQGVAALEIVWDEGANAALTTAAMQATVSAALLRPGAVARNQGDAQKMVDADPKKVEATYFNPLLAHAPMEPMNCTVHVRADSADIWVGTQVPARARDAAAKILGLAPEKVTLHNHLLGGGFGRRLEHDYIDQAVAIARQVPVPLKVTWTREEDIQHDIFRGMYAHKVSATLDTQGFPLALVHKLSGPSTLATFAPGWIKADQVDIDAVDGSVGYPYEIANMRTEHTREDGAIPTGFWRGVGPTRNLLVLESFMDELAFKAGKDPLAYRLAMLSKNPRATKVLKTAAERAGWGAPLPARSGRGIALMFAWDTYLAQVVDVAVDDDGTVKVQRVVCVVDCGTVVNPDTVAAQIQGGINFGLTAALYGEITIDKGRAVQSNFHDYPMLRMNEAPRIDVEIVPSTEPPGGIGEPGTAGVGAAFVNAVFAATGKRLYSLPAKPEQLAKAAKAV